MTRIAALALLAASGAAGLAALSTQAAAQSSEKISEIIVYGNDPCPRSTDDDIVVCARKPESERYRIPERFRVSGPRQTREAWANKAKVLETVSATGINSCSPVGPAGFTGCLQRVIKEAREESKETTAETTPPEE